jgi:hypothetical protein
LSLIERGESGSDVLGPTLLKAVQPGLCLAELRGRSGDFVRAGAGLNLRQLGLGCQHACLRLLDLLVERRGVQDR